MSAWGRWRRSLTITVTVRIFVFMSLIILGVVGYLLHNQSRVLEKELQSRGLLTASHLAQESVDPILREDDYALFKHVQLLRGSHRREVAGDERILYAMVLDLKGQVLAHSEAGKVQTVLDDRRTRDVLERLEPSVAPAVTLDGERLFDVAVPIQMRGQPVGAVRLGISRAGVDRLMGGLALKVLSVLFLLMLLGIGSIWRFSRRIVRPIQRLRDVALAVQAGDLSRRVPVDRPDEIGQLATAFNAMTEELERSRVEIERKDEMRARLLEKVITAQEDERKRIARELHDETSQSLTSLMVGLKVLEERPDRAEVREALGNLRTLAGKTLDAVHDLALQLRPSVLDDLGLVPALARLAADFRRTHGVPVSFETNLQAGPRLPASLESALYRITQEALTNVGRHAAATAVSLLLELRGGSLRLIVEDNGRGFDALRLDGRDSDERRLGLFGMRERATLLGGRLTIESTPGHGTTLFVEVPLPREITHERAKPDPHPARG